MPLWLIRLTLGVLAFFLLAHAAAYLVQSGALHTAASAVNPNNPNRQLERSIFAALDAGRADTIIVGSAPFIAAVGKACRLGNRVVPIVIDSPRFRDYWDVVRHVGRLRSSLIVLQARPYLWTNMRDNWPNQRTELLPSWKQPEILPLDDVRILLSVLKEMAQGRGSAGADDGASYDLTGALYDDTLAERYLSRISDRLAGRDNYPSAVFLLDEVPLLDKALPKTRAAVLERFETPSPLPKVEFMTADRFAVEHQCRNLAIAGSGS